MFRQFTRAELWEVIEDTQNSLLNESGALENPGHHLGLEADLARSLLHEMDSRVHGPSL